MMIRRQLVVPNFILLGIRFLHLVVNLLLHGVVFIFLFLLFLVSIRAMNNKSVTLSEIITPKRNVLKNVVETNFCPRFLRLRTIQLICFLFIFNKFYVHRIRRDEGEWRHIKQTNRHNKREEDRRTMKMFN